MISFIETFKILKSVSILIKLILNLIKIFKKTKTKK